LNVANNREDDDAMSISLVVTDFAEGEGKFETFMSSFTAASTTLHASLASEYAQGSCAIGVNPLPFQNVLVITSDNATAINYNTMYSNSTHSVEAVGRGDPTISGWWDLCSANVTTAWFMLVGFFLFLSVHFCCALISGVCVLCVCVCVCA
jgi:hypothetical protein